MAALYLEEVKTLLGVRGDYQDDTISEYIAEVTDFLTAGGVALNDITPGIVARGVSDLWNYGSGEAKFSQYFLQRAAQLTYTVEETT